MRRVPDKNHFEGLLGGIASPISGEQNDVSEKRKSEELCKEEI